PQVHAVIGVELYLPAALVEPDVARRHALAGVAVPQHVGPADDLGQQEIPIAQPQQGPRLPAARPGPEGFSGKPPEKLARVGKPEKPRSASLVPCCTISRPSARPIWRE